MLLQQIALTLLPGVGNVTGKNLLPIAEVLEAVFKQKKEKH